MLSLSLSQDKRSTYRGGGHGRVDYIGETHASHVSFTYNDSKGERNVTDRIIRIPLRIPGVTCVNVLVLGRNRFDSRAGRNIDRERSLPFRAFLTGMEIIFEIFGESSN